MLDAESYAVQSETWPPSGRHILAQYDDQTIIVYQAYRPSIARYATEHGRFGGDEFSLSRMSWIKPNFMWMMYRNGWGTKKDQEVTLALRLRREFFDGILRQAVPSSWDQISYPDQAAWQTAVQQSDVRVQWDPDHGPNGDSLARRAIQLGLRGSVLRSFASTEIIEFIDLAAFVAEQRPHIANPRRLMTPRERVYRLDDPVISQRLRLDS